MKPHIICHMASSLDGRILPSRWRPQYKELANPYESLHEKLGGQAWLVGRVTGQEFAKRQNYPELTAAAPPREGWFATREADNFAVVLDAHGKIAWGRKDIGGDPIVVVLTEQASDAHLAGLRADGVSYFFAGAREIDLTHAVETLRRDLGVDRLLLEGGGHINGAFLRAGLINEISLILLPAVDGAHGGTSLFDSGEDGTQSRAPVRHISLRSSEALDGSALWLRYDVTNA